MGFHKNALLKTLFEENRLFSKFLKHTHKKGLKFLFTKHFEFGVRFLKHLKEAKSFEWGKTFQNSLFLKAVFAPRQ
jgi:hypothetical protein